MEDVVGHAAADSDANQMRQELADLRVEAAQLRIQVRALEEQLRQAQKLEAIGSLTAGIAHDFNNMLTVIVPTLELVTKLLPPDRAPLVQEASHAARRATQMVQQLMTYAGQSRLAEQRPHLIRPVLEAAVGLCRRAFAPEIEIETHYEHAALPSVVSCNPTQLEQVIVNVLMNARDAVREADRKKGRVYVRARLCESRVVIEVGDNGAGMSESVRARAFEPFFTTKGAGHGTGLGLATSFAIVRDHQGELSCESQPGVGTTMTIVLPQSEQSASAPTDPPMQSVPTGRCVLLVDDEVAVRTTLCYVLGDAGVSVLVAESGSAALAMLEQHRDVVDLVLLDRSMPGGAGERFVPRLRAISPRVRIVFLSGQMVEPELAALVDGVVQKPVTGPALLDAIQRAVSMTEPRAESRAQAHAAPRT